jgi:hypothetical protein
MSDASASEPGKVTEEAKGKAQEQVDKANQSTGSGNQGGKKS